MPTLQPEPVPAAILAHVKIARSLGTSRPGMLALARHAIVSPSRQARVACLYSLAPEWDAAAVPAFRAFREETLRQLDVMIGDGWSITVTEQDPYVDAAALRADVAHKRISVMSTATTGGHPYLSNDDNDAFRAVHDVVAHCATGRGFDRHGEEAAYRAHFELYSAAARPALAAETRGQNACLIANGTFPDQKIATLPPRWITPLALAPTAGEYAAAYADAIARHR